MQMMDRGRREKEEKRREDGRRKMIQFTCGFSSGRSIKSPCFIGSIRETNSESNVIIVRNSVKIGESNVMIVEIVRVMR